MSLISEPNRRPCPQGRPRINRCCDFAQPCLGAERLRPCESAQRFLTPKETAHSISKRIPPPPNQRCMGSGFFRGCRRLRRRAASGLMRNRIVRKSTKPPRARSARSVSMFAKIGSSNAVQSHKIRTKVGIRLVFFAGGQRKPVIQRGAARFARVEGEVRAEDFLEGGFFGGVVFGFGYFIKHLSLFEPLAHGFEPNCAVPFKQQDSFLQRLLFGH